MNDTSRDTASRGRSTLADVAKHAGVSPSTASKAINGRRDVSAATRARVEAAIAATGYDPIHGAAPRTRPTVEFLVDVLTSPYAMEILRGVTLAAETAGVDVVVGRFRRTDADADADIIGRLVDAERMGAIIVTAEVSDTTYAAITESGIPVVFVDPLRVEGAPVVSVGSTNWIGGRSATEYLIGLGHRRLAMLGGPETSVSAVARMDGFRSAAESAAVTVEPRFVAHTQFEHDSAQAIAEGWLALPDRPTGIVASSDAQALGVLEAARRLGLRVPEDLSVVGYDDTYVASWAHPPLTSVYQPLQDIGRVCLRTVQRLAAGKPLDSHHIELATRLVVRESTAPPAPQEHP